MRPGSALALAQRLAAGTLTLGEAFAFMSGLYFRGKLAYATTFGRVLVITPTRGLLPPDTTVTVDLLREFAGVDVDAGDARYREPMDQALRDLKREIHRDTRIVLLGSIATGKYVDVLTAALGDRLYFPSSFVGRGDMSRGGLLLRSAADGRELEYSILAANVPRHGARPPKLEPLKTPKTPRRSVHPHGPSHVAIRTTSDVARLRTSTTRTATDFTRPHWRCDTLQRCESASTWAAPRSRASRSMTPETSSSGRVSRRRAAATTPRSRRSTTW